MPSKQKQKELATGAPARSEFDDSEGVTTFLEALDHPLKPVLVALRETIRSVPGVTEGIKWNAPSFYCHGWFATVNLRAAAGVLLVLHHGAKSQKESTLPDTIADPAQLLKWLARDRATILFSSAEDFASKQKPFQKLIKQWVKHQASLAKSGG
ncbi:MAG: DUF1801 domain-containing protein [Acidobacteria bacterium]|nr:DUF1801 domain-containing protein [Acidobacteriota bacterium]